MNKNESFVWGAFWGAIITGALVVMVTIIKTTPDETLIKRGMMKYNSSTGL